MVLASVSSVCRLLPVSASFFRFGGLVTLKTLLPLDGLFLHSFAGWCRGHNADASP